MDNRKRILRLRQAYLRNGYKPVPLRDRLKYPTDTGWPDQAREVSPHICNYPPRLGFYGTGILCDGLRPIDVDVDDPLLADIIVQGALVQFGTTPMRFRAGSPRKLLIYRAPDGETPPKSSIKNSITGHGVEILGRGNQFFSDGQHPAGVPLQWRGDPIDWPRDQLRVLDEQHVESFLLWCAKVLDADLIRTASARHRPPSGLPDVSAPMAMATGSGAAWHLADITSALDAIPNRHTDWETWWRVGAAVYAASQGHPVAYDIWRAWSVQSPAFDDRITHKTWRSYSTSPVAGITPGTLRWHATQHNPAWQKKTDEFTQLRCFSKRS